MDDFNDSDLLLAAARSVMAQVHTVAVGTVASYDHATLKATVRIAVKRKLRDGQTGAITNEEVALIPNVPVLFPRATGYADTFPLTVGDAVLLLIVERSIDEWKTTGAASCEAQDVRRFDYADAVALPVESSFARPPAVTSYAAGARVIEAPTVLLGSALATEGVLKGTSFEAHLATWNEGMRLLLVGLATGVPATIATAAATFQLVHSAFTAQVAAGHTSTVTKTT